MTDPYQQTNINVPMSGARYVAQSDIDTTLAVPAVVLNADDEFIIASDDDDITDYQINLPEVTEVTGKDGVEDVGYYEIDADMQLKHVDDPSAHNWLKKQVAIPEEVLTVDDASVLYIDDAGKRFRLP